MKKKDKAFVYIVVGLMVFSAFALSAIVLFGSDESQDAATGTQTVEIEEEPEVATNPIVEGVEWPIVLEETLEELVIEDLVEGTGDEVKEDDVIVANYRLARADGTPVAGNDTFAGGSPFTAQLSKGALIDGWVQGLPGMKEGGLRRLQVPTSLAYSAGDLAGVDLVFDVEIVEVNP